MVAAGELCCLSDNSGLSNISAFLYIHVKLFAYAGEQMSNLGLLLKTVFCEDMKFMQNIKFLIHI